MRGAIRRLGRLPVSWFWAAILGAVAFPVVLLTAGHTTLAPENPHVAAASGRVVIATVVGGCTREDGFHFGVCVTRVSYLDDAGQEHVVRLSITDDVRQSSDPLRVRYDIRAPGRATLVKGNPNDFERYMTVFLFGLAGAFYAFAGSALLIAGVRRALPSTAR